MHSVESTEGGGGGGGGGGVGKKEIELQPAAGKRKSKARGRSRSRSSRRGSKSGEGEHLAGPKPEPASWRQEQQQPHEQQREQDKHQASEHNAVVLRHDTESASETLLATRAKTEAATKCEGADEPARPVHDNGVQVVVSRQPDISEDEEQDEEQDDDPRVQVKRPLIKPPHKLTRSRLSLKQEALTSNKSNIMIQQHKPATFRSETNVPLLSELQLLGASRCSSSGQASGASSSSSACARSMLGTGTGGRSSSAFALDMPPMGHKCDSSSIVHKTAANNSRRARTSSSDGCARGHRAPNVAPDGTTELDSFCALQTSAAKLERTISRSMLELDPAIKENEQFQVFWRHLTFSYEASWRARLRRNARNQPPVLDDLSGSLGSNQLVAIIGPSGCGKTTLLQFLAGNNPGQSERLRICGIEEPKVAFIGQDDGLLPGLTARETLMFASRLQNKSAHFDHANHIQPILDELGLSDCCDRCVSKLSGGQAKRVTIAQELLYPTNLLILDEVTSGLDASTSYSIVKLLKYLVSDCSYPMSIVMSIHQPSARLFSVFDRVYVMSDGCCLYQGSCNLNQINEHLRHFQLECPKFHNIADYLIELASCAPDDWPPATANGCGGGGGGGAQGPSGAAIKRQMIEFQRKQCDQLLTHPLARPATPTSNGFCHRSQQRLEKSALDGCQQGDSDSSLYAAIERARNRRPRPFWDHLAIHFSRSLMRIRRSYILTWLQLITYVVLGIQLATFYGPDIGQLSGCPRLPGNLLGFILAPSDTSEQQEHEMTHEIRRIQENMNFLLVAVMTATFAALEITVITFPLEAKTVKREWRNGWYRVSSYFVGRTLADLPFQLVFVSLFSLLIYVLTSQIGLDSWRFAAFTCTLLMTAFVAQSFGFMFGALFMDNLPAAVFTAPLAIFPTLLFSGFFSRVSQVPAFYQPLTYFSHFRYAFDALLVTLYGYDRCNCDQEALTGYHASLANQSSSMRDTFHLLFGAYGCITGDSGSGSDSDSGSDSSHEPDSAAGVASAATTRSPLDSAGAISHDDLAAIHAGNSSLAAQVIAMIRTTVRPSGQPDESSLLRSARAPPPGPSSNLSSNSNSNSSASSSFKQLEDMLVDTIFQQMSSVSDSSTSSELALGQDNFGGASASSNATSTSTSMMDRLATRFSNKLTTMLSKQANFGKPMPSECAHFNSYLLTEFSLNDDDLWFGLLMLLAIVLITRLLCNFILHFTIASRIK